MKRQRGKGPKEQGTEVCETIYEGQETRDEVKYTNHLPVNLVSLKVITAVQMTFSIATLGAQEVTNVGGSIPKAFDASIRKLVGWLHGGPIV